MPVWEAPDDEGEDAPRQSYNFAPGYHGVVYRADTPDWGAGPRHGEEDRASSQGGGEDARQPAVAASTAEEEEAQPTATSPTEEDAQQPTTASPTEGDEEARQPTAASTTADDGGAPVRFKLQSMKWGLVPFWTKRNPDYGTLLRTINCRDDSLARPGGMWTTMKARKRCVVVAQGFYEWLKTGPKERVPHYIRRRDGHLLYMAGLWDCVQYQQQQDGEPAPGAVGSKNYTYTVITTDSNAQLAFLHDACPSSSTRAAPELSAWLDPARHKWTPELQGLLRPFQGQLDIYAVSKDVNKVGNSSPSFIVPVASRENKANIANFFANAAAATKKSGHDGHDAGAEPHIKTEQNRHAPSASPQKGIKREADDDSLNSNIPESKITKTTAAGTNDIKAPPSSPPTSSPPKKNAAAGVRAAAKISATSNGRKPSPAKPKKSDGSQKITKFFANAS